jgi:hypothetical protein
MRNIEKLVILSCAITVVLLSATAAGTMQGGGSGRMVNPTTAEVGIAPDVSVYGATLGFGRRWDTFRVSVAMPYYVVENSDSENGLGNVRVLGEWDIVPPAQQRLSLIGSLLWKIPTADEDKGLGTVKPTLARSRNSTTPLAATNRFSASATSASGTRPPSITATPGCIAWCFALRRGGRSLRLVRYAPERSARFS